LLPSRAPALRLSSWKLFDRLIPEDDAATRAAKERESRVITSKLQRSKFAEMFAAQKEKLVVATSAVLPPAAAAVFPTTLAAQPLAAGAPPLALPAAFAQQRVTLVAVAFQGMGQAQAQVWTEGFLARFRPQALAGSGAAAAAPPAVGLLNVLYLDGWFWRVLSSVIRDSTRRSLPPALVPHTAILTETSEKATDVRVGGGEGPAQRADQARRSCRSERHTPLRHSHPPTCSTFVMPSASTTASWHL